MASFPILMLSAKRRGAGGQALHQSGRPSTCPNDDDDDDQCLIGRTACAGREVASGDSRRGDWGVLPLSELDLEMIPFNCEDASYRRVPEACRGRSVAARLELDRSVLAATGFL